ncbi:hypothetical protein BGZ61DRAFT_358136 [Ilyonectria robusta]|uniref:uncharacterized protein n=1 Tax=Ilyonectria robusta TaxID=1079257 RepID=UPI001E8DD5A8|nr:uncharacterized protein BGZ61DRAFT_358136 [Ilyonectria robusta]KAH8683417.1 hypothetical protein BGZ61DRAFT_358136 [Ilyonectria robusta]
MTASAHDNKVAAMAVGFTIGFGFLTTWEAIKHTRRNRNPLRSAYIYMLWGEIISNVGITVIGWIWIDEVVKSSVPVLFFILFFWVFEVQLLMQIIINRIAIIAEHRSTIDKIKWGTAMIMTCINIAVFCIFIPAHRDPPVSELFVQINRYWDRTSKFLIMILDAALNWYFLHIVEKRLVQQHNLTKYKPLVAFNAKLMVLSIAMDAMLIGLMWLPNQSVFIQFHPVTYMVKLNIEMSMAKLITRLASRGNSDEDYPELSNSNPSNGQSGNRNNPDNHPWTKSNSVKLVQMSKVVVGESEEDLSSVEVLGSGAGIRKRTKIEVKVESDSRNYGGRSKQSISLEDELPLTSNTGHPKQDEIRVAESETRSSRDS